MIDLKVIRDSLVNIADKLPNYSDALKLSGFSCCHIDNDWIAQNCTNEEIDFHQRYLVEYAREAIASDSTSTIVYEDELNCRSWWLNELKSKRLVEFGTVDNLFKSSKTRHLVELSPCLRKLSKIRELPDISARIAEGDMVKEFVRRWSSELIFHKEEIDLCIVKLGFKWDEPSLQKAYAMQVTESFASLGARMIRTFQMYGSTQAVSFNVKNDLEFVLLPLLTCSERTGQQLTNGKIGMGYRLTFSSALGAEKFDRSKSQVLHLNTLLPKEFIDYGRFNNPEDMCLNIFARIEALKNIIPGVLKILRQ